MATQRAAYFKGVRLWEWFQEGDPWAQRTTMGVHEGLGRSWADRVPDSPNFDREIPIYCVVDQMAAESDLSGLTSIENVLHDVEADLIANSKTAGHLSICDDPERKADVTGGPYSGDAAVVAHGAVGGSWSRQAGRYVLARNPASGEGFVAPIQAVDASATDLTFDIPSGVSVTSAWDLVDVQRAYESCTYLRMHGGSARDSGMDSAEGDQWRATVTYFIACNGAVLMATAHIPAHDNT